MPGGHTGASGGGASHAEVPRRDQKKVGHRWGLTLGVLSTVWSVTTVWAWSAHHTESAETLRLGRQSVTTIMRREQQFYAANHAYATTLEELGIRPDASNPWNGRVIAARVSGEPLILVEADDGNQRLAVAADWTVYRSPLVSLPVLPAWQPEHGEEEHHEGR